MTQPWRPSGPLPPPQARPLPPGPVYPGQHRQGMPPVPQGYGPPPPYGAPPPTRQYPVPPPGVPPYGTPYGGTPHGGPPYGPPYVGPSYGAPPWLHYPGHPHMLRPRQKSNAPAIIAGCIVAVLVGAVALVGFLSLGDDTRTNVADTGETPSYETTYAESTTTTTTTTTTTEETTDEETTEHTETEEPSGPRPVYSLGDNPLFFGDVGAPAVTCDLAAWETSPAGAAAFFQSAMPCLDAAWQPIMEYQGLPFFTPNIQFPEGTEWSSPCGSVSHGNGAVAAFYCSEDNTLYMPFGGLQTEMYGAHPGVYLAVLAHEYGHHVQAMSGVLDAYGQARYDAGTDSELGLEFSRRLELQAQCFSGMFFAAAYGRGSVDDNILTEARTTQDRGDHTPGMPRDHGSDEHAIAWWEQGAQLNRTFQCNTWVVDSAHVA